MEWEERWPALCPVQRMTHQAPDSLHTLSIQMPQEKEDSGSEYFGTISRRIHTQEARPEQATWQENRGGVGEA